MSKISGKFSKALFLIPAGFIALMGIGITWYLSSRTQSPITVEELSAPAPRIDDPQLGQLAHASTNSLERSRARYLLAISFLKKYQGGQASKELDGLEQDYPTMQPYIWLKQGRAYQLTNDLKNASDLWKKVASTYKNSPIEAEALYRLNSINSRYGDQAIREYPQYPLTIDILEDRLKQNPNQPNLLKILVANQTDVSPQILNTLVKKYSAQLTPKDWENIATSYWQRSDYQNAILAYGKASKTPSNLYGLSRLLQLTNKNESAKKEYKYIVKLFPKSQEAPKALSRLTQLSQGQEAIGYLDKLIKQYPREEAQALKDKVEILEKLGNQEFASKISHVLLTKYPKSDPASDYRWQKAFNLSQKGDLRNASTLAIAILNQNPTSPVAPKANYWLGKWFRELGKKERSVHFFKRTIAKYPQSYFAWRSAVNLGADVGDFNNVSLKKVTVEIPQQDNQPISGSILFRELFRLRQWSDAQRLYRGEMRDKKSLNVNDLFTEAILESKRNRFMEAHNTIMDLKKKDSPEDQHQLQSLRSNSDYWYTLFPFPYQEDIINISQKNKLNPLLVIALIRQESGFQPDIKSPVGALGLMQVMPSTAKSVAKQIELPQYSLVNPKNNINLGTWYLKNVHQQYKDDSMLAVASYNAGPGNVNKWIKRYGLKDHDAFVEKIPFEETQKYVEAVFGNYWNYLRLYNPEVAGWITKDQKLEENF